MNGPTNAVKEDVRQSMADTEESSSSNPVVQPRSVQLFQEAPVSLRMRSTDFCGFLGGTETILREARFLIV